MLELGSPNIFISNIFSRLEENKIDVSNYQLDHICYRVETWERYLQLTKVLANKGELLAETMIGGRPIASFLLEKPFFYKNRSINCIELPSPKEGSPYREGFEHVEFVIDLPFEEFIQKYPSLNFKTKGMNKAVNADISIKFPEGVVKFHHHTLEYVISSTGFSL